MRNRAKTEWEENGFTLVEAPTRVRTLEDEVGLIGWHLSGFFYVPWPKGMSPQAHEHAEAEALASYRNVVVSALDPMNRSAREWLIEHHPKNEVINARRAVYLVDAWLSLARAKQGLSRGDRDAPRHHVAAASYSLDQANEDFVSNEASETRSRVAQSGGAATKRDAVRQKFIRLLIQQIPKNGWTSQSDAARTLAPLLITFIEKRPSTGMKTENIERQLLRWLSIKGSDERNAYDATRRA